ncbi:MAG: hypothetical protein HC847_24580 [Hydrococcus sp. RU_2_2]|nr:hypothetical protein [Hydrococcus sp. RU_2_2]
MNKALRQMSDAELRSFLKKNRNDEEAFSQALEVLMERKKYSFKYSPPSEMSYEQAEGILKSKLNKNKEIFGN